MTGYRQIWVADFEFRAPPGHRPEVVCLCAYEMLSGRSLRLWADELDICPFDTSPDCLFVGYYVSAELGCFRALGWPMPERILDLYAEFRLIANGRHLSGGYGLLGALANFGLEGMAVREKKSLRDRIMAGPPFSSEDRAAILDYCAEDVRATAALLEAMEPWIAPDTVRFGQALLRGRYAAAVAAMEHNGVPIDPDLLPRLRTNWPTITLALISEVDTAFGVYDNGHFREHLFENEMRRRGIDWPRLPTGRLTLDAEVFRSMAHLYPEIEPLRQLRTTLGEMRLNDLHVGPDGRNRTLLSPYGSKTGRNQPSSSRFIFGPAVWLRALIKPAPGRAIAYLDFTAQEIAIAAALSGDGKLIEAVRSGDPYLSFAKRANLVPDCATKASHGQVRDAMKSLTLAVGYGMQAPTLAARLKRSVPEAAYLLRLYDEAYPRFANWRQEELDRSLLGLNPRTVFGWSMVVDETTKPTTLRNYPVQATGAEILRLSCSLATERGVIVDAPVHDALLVEDEEDRIELTINATRLAMAEASRIVLDGFEIATDVKIVRYPERYTDPRGEALFRRIVQLLPD
jgi:DNA polymerase I